MAEKYEFKKGNISKNGHTMFIEDVLTDLKRKSYLEDEYSKIRIKHKINYDFNSKEYQIKLLQNFEKRIISKSERKRSSNVWLVSKILLEFTGNSGSSSAYEHCEFLGIDPDGKSFFE